VKGLVVALCVLASGGLWAWAVLAPKRLPPLPAALVREFRLFRFEPPGDRPVINPFDLGHEQRFRFGAEGTYIVQFLVAGGHEMVRWQGTVVQEGNVLVLRQVSVNGVAEPAPDRRFRYEWRADQEGEFLVFAADPDGYRLFLRTE
jgi:hypothetical protein